MASFVYGMCALTAILVAWLLLQAWSVGRYRLLLWAGLCFVGLSANNVLLVIDKVVFDAGPDLTILRSVVALAAMAVLLYGLIVDAE
jgi:hypothetical protein